jgi:hypothetical protein
MVAYLERGRVGSAEASLEGRSRSTGTSCIDGESAVDVVVRPAVGSRRHGAERGTLDRSLGLLNTAGSGS